MPFLDSIEFADAFEDVTYTCVGDTTSESFLPSKGHAVVRQNGMHAVREGHKHLAEETVLRWLSWRCQRTRHE